jgi:hypothetical protein
MKRRSGTHIHASACIKLLKSVQIHNWVIGIHINKRYSCSCEYVSFIHIYKNMYKMICSFSREETQLKVIYIYRIYRLMADLRICCASAQQTSKLCFCTNIIQQLHLLPPCPFCHQLLISSYTSSVPGLLRCQCLPSGPSCPPPLFCRMHFGWAKPGNERNFGCRSCT